MIPSLALAIVATACESKSPAPKGSESAPITAHVECTPRVEGSSDLTSEWQPFSSFIETCRVVASDGTSPLEIIAVSAKLYYADRPSGAVTAALPKPLLRSARHEELGRLMYNYPDDPPVAIELTFLEWRDGLPQQIDILVRDPTVSGDHELTPLRWDASRRHYIGGEEH